MDWIKFGFVIASKYRIKILLSLFEKPLSPKEISNLNKLYISHVSSTLTILKNEGIIECLNPKQRKGKIFVLTVIGKEIVEELIKRNY